MVPLPTARCPAVGPSGPGTATAIGIGPFLYAGPVFAGVLDGLICCRLPDALFIAGAVLVVVAATLALRIRGGSPVIAAGVVDPSLRSG